MKSPYLLSSAHDLAICTRSAQASHKDFVATTQTVVSQCSTELSFLPAVHTILADVMPAIHTIHNRVSRYPDFEYPPLVRCSSSFRIGRRHAAFSSVSFCRLQLSEMGFANGPPDNTVRTAMTIPTQIQKEPLIPCSFLTFRIHTWQYFAASATG